MPSARVRRPVPIVPARSLSPSLAWSLSAALLLLTAFPSAAPGQGAADAPPGSIGTSAAAVTAGELRATVGVLAADSMRGRDTPSPELDAAARWVARRFGAAGVKPGLGTDGYLQWFPLTVVAPGRAAAQRLVISGPDGSDELTVGEDFVVLPAGGDASAEGPLTPWRPDDGEPPPGAVALVGSEPREIGRTLAAVRSGLESGGTLGAVVAVRGEERWFRRIADFLSGRQVTLGEPDGLGRPVVLVRGSAMPDGLAEVLEDGGEAGGWSARLATAADLDTARAPNVVGWVEGTDPELKTEYVVLTAHLDHLGVGEPVEGDSIYNGADDDASGVAAVLEVAQSLAAEPARRSVVFVAVSGEERGLYGSRWYTEHPVFPLEHTVAAVNIDMIGRNWRDTVVAVGRELSTLGETARRVAGEHPELGVSVVADRWPDRNYFRRSDHYEFAREGIPALFFFSGTHEDYHRPSDEAGLLDYGKTARIVRLIERVIREVADAAGRPEWNPEAYDRVVESGGEG